MNDFKFKRFTIKQDLCAMKVGTDGVLLGAWVNVAETKRILDVGAGTGLIAIMCAQRSNAMIDAVEIDKDAYRQAVDNSKACPWPDRIQVYHDSFRHYATNTETRYDLIVSNPPYFRNSLKPSSKARSLARHDDRLSFEELLFCTSMVLGTGGRLAVIIPANETSYFIDLAYFQGLGPVRQTMVKPHEMKRYSRAMLEFSNGKNLQCVNNEIVIKKSGTNDYTDDYRNLAKEYYLKFNV